ncbi:MAG: 2-oxoacid:ferredoxin oxidoreductase subunit beta [Chloroflexi bacterium RBG_13_46_9]|jgi:2-oxoglutarate ferredoxin oxidoreductase subunit beta|nr:MAG: 2-oxoacid:ferredoxin oxidoreductase subunit beta [Chloroflexi bacterium RBG_13_46_9]
MKITEIARIGEHPLDEMLRTDRLPHIWCPGCGLGTILGATLRAINKSGLDLDKTIMVSGIGCTGRAAGYVKLDSFHVTHGRALPFATGLKFANPDLKVVVFSGDGDMAAIGGNHLIHAARRNVDMTVICVNNFNYGMTGGQMGPTTPQSGKSTTSRSGNVEKPFNIPYLVGAAGAPFVARWTTAHIRQMERTFLEAIHKKGFSFVEVISPCPTYYGRMNEQATGLEQMRYYRYNSIVKHYANLEDVDITLGGQIVVGKFIDYNRPYLPAPVIENGK